MTGSYHGPDITNTCTAGQNTSFRAISAGKGRETLQSGMVRRIREIYVADGPVFACIAARMWLFSEARFQFQSMIDKHLFGTPDLSILEQPWPNATDGELLSRMEQDDSTAGNSFIRRATPEDDSGDQLVQMRPDCVSIVTEELRDTMGRKFRRPIGYMEDLRSLGIEQDPQFYDVTEVCHYCADEDTQILTATGWKTVDELRAGDEALTLNHGTGLTEWQPVSEVCVFPARSREMLSMEGREHSSLTTLNHRWPAEYRISRRGTYGRRWVTSETIGAGDRIPVAGYSADLPSEPKWSDSLVETVAWFWTEGCILNRKGRASRAVSISQSAVTSDGNVARIRAALTALFGPALADKTMSHRVPRWNEHLSGRNVIFTLNSVAGDVLTEHAPGKVVTTRFLRSLTSAQLDLFIKVSLLADNNGPRRLAQKNPAAAEAFALACILAGHGVSIRPGSESYLGYRMTNVRMLSKRHIYPQESKRERSSFRVRRVQHDGRVWCPRTPNQTWMARRNGTVYFTGNSPMPDPLAQFRGMSWLTPVMREVGADTAMTEYKIAHLQSGAMPGLVIKYPRRLSEPTVDRLRRRMQAKFGGPENAGKTLILDEGADVTVAGSTLEQLQAVAITEAGERRICSAAGVPLEVVGLKDGDYVAAMRRFADLWARPHWRMACASLQHLVKNVPPQGVRLWFDTDGIAALREGELTRAQAFLVRSQAVQSMVMAGFTRESVIAAVTAGDISQLKPSPDAPPPGIAGRETATEKLGPDGKMLPAGQAALPGAGSGRPPQGAVPQALPGVVAKNLPNAKPGQFAPTPGLKNGARGPRAGK